MFRIRRWGLLALLALPTAGRATVVYVNKNATAPPSSRNGASWATGYATVEDGLADRHAGDEVWVAAAAYTEYVIIPRGVALYGGFAGTETRRDQRRPAVNRTSITNTSRISESVVQVAAASGRETVIDGFTLSGGSGHSVMVAAAPPGGGVATYSTEGGGIFMADASPTITNNVITGNATPTCSECSFAPGQGGGIAAIGSSAPLIANNVITSNFADLGAAVYAPYGSVVNNTILYNSGFPQAECVDAAVIANNVIAFNVAIGVAASSSTTLSHNDVYGNIKGDYNPAGADLTGVNGNIKADPLFANTRTADFRIQANSPCVNAGDDGSAAGIAADFEGQPRIQGSHVDIGADENDGTVYVSPYRPITYVRPDGDDANDGFSWATAKRTIAAANGAVADGGEIWVAQGTYAAPKDAAYESNFAIYYGASLYGGFTGTETSREQRAPRLHETILTASETSSSYLIVIGAGTAEGSVPGTTVDGFTVRDNLIGQNGFPPGAAVIFGAVSHFTNNVVTGGGLYTDFGGDVANNTFSGSPQYGIIARSGAGHIMVYRNVVHGCAYGISSLDATVKGNLVYGNTGTFNGGIDAYMGTVTNNTIVGNGGTAVGGLYLTGGATAENNLIVSNEGTQFGSRSEPNGVGVNIVDSAYTYNDAFANNYSNYLGTDPTGTNGNISADPLFVDAAHNDYHLAAGSPAINAGDNAVVDAGGVDLDGQPRILNGRVDMGAYEYHAVAAGTFANAVRALRLAAGLTAGSTAGLDVAPSNGKVDILDAVRLLRQANGLDS